MPKKPRTEKPSPDKNSPDKASLSRRVQRYAKVSTTVGGLGLRLAGQKYLGLDIDKASHARQLMEQLGNLKGPLLKVAQLLATIPNALPEEYTRELQKLQSQAPPMGWPFVRRRMSTELGANWEKKFKTFTQEAAAAASLGQVHRATLPDGTAVACKLQYPDMQSAVTADLKQLKFILAAFEKYDNSISTAEIQKEIAARLHEELDYELEARHAQLYAFMLKGEKAAHVPEVVPALSTERLLTATWLDGAPMLDFVKAKQADRNALALNMFRAWYVPLYNYGVIHGDPHPGNYTVRKDLGINLLDFGCVRIFPPRFVEGVITLYRALQEDDTDMAVAAYTSWGFKKLNKELIGVLNVWARFLYGPILDNKTRAIGVVGKKGIYGREIAHNVHQELKRIGGVQLPREFVFMDRAALGLGSVFLHLKSEVNWYRLFNELIDGFDVKELEKRQKKALKQFDIDITP